MAAARGADRGAGSECGVGMKLKKTLADLTAACANAEALVIRARQALQQAEIGLIQADARLRLMQELTAKKPNGDQ